MRPKFVFAMLMALVLLGVAVALKLRPETAPPPAPVVRSAPVPAETVKTPAPVVIPPAPPTPEERQDAINAETARLTVLGMRHDPESLSNILADLTSPEPKIRKAAIEAVQQFGGTNAIPALRAAAANVEDPKEGIAMLEAAQFLSLPDAEIPAPDPNAVLTPEQQQAIQASRARAAQRRQKYLLTHPQGQAAVDSPGGAVAQDQNPAPIAASP